MAPGTYYYGVSYVYGSYETAMGHVSRPAASRVGVGQSAICDLDVSDRRPIRAARVLRFGDRVCNAPGTFYLTGSIANASSLNNNDTKADASSAPLARTRTRSAPHRRPRRSRCSLASIAPSSNPKVTSIRLYRHVTATNDYRVVTTLANTSAPYIDAHSDAALGASRGMNLGPIGTPPGDQAIVTVPTVRRSARGRPQNLSIG